MNKQNLNRMILLIALSLFSCKKSNQGSNPEKKPIPTEHGTAAGIATTQIIGPSGGIIQSPDGNIKIEIPAGALTSEVNLSIQPVTSTLQSATGTVYRLGPENVNFQKDVRISFKYTDENLIGTTENDLYIAYQDAEGYWRRVILTDIDKSNRILSVSTRHFSDWTLERIFYIKVRGESTLSANENTKLEVHYDDISTIHSTDNDALLAPGGPVPVKNIGGWFINGAGKVDNPSSNVVVYTAPASIPAPATIAVGVNIKNMVNKRHPDRPGNTGLVIVQVPIQLVPEEYFIWEFDGSSHIALSIDGALIGTTTNIIGTGLSGGVSLWLNEAKPGSYDQGSAVAAGNFSLQLSVSNQPSVIWLGTYYNCNESTPRYGKGKLNITNYGNIAGFIEGDFTATVYTRESSCTNRSKQISGSFKIRRKA
ncbi:hypothetical protein [Chitinophaga niabensis]|nr:hypothetical protein [Chitinophaga niabensis]